MTDIYIAGVGMTQFGKQIDVSLKELTADAVNEALADAGCTADQLDAAFFGNCVQGHMEGQDMIRGEVALRSMGIQGIPIVNVENACATASTALHMAANYVKAGVADVVLAIGAEKMFSRDKERMFKAFDGGWDVHEVEHSTETLLKMGEGVEVPEGTTSDRPYSVFMDIYAAYTVEEILAAPPITYPLTLPMCSPISDGAAAAIVCNAAGLERLNGDRARAVKLLASVLRTGSDRAPDDFDSHISRRAADEAYELAGVGPERMSVAEVHDATATGEVIEVEALRLVPPGEGARAAERGETALGGRIPVNPSGGLECKGHPVGATGLGQVYELVTQLRGEAGPRQVPDAEYAIAQNGGGIIGVEESVTAVTIMGRQ